MSGWKPDDDNDEEAQEFLGGIKNLNAGLNKALEESRKRIEKEMLEAKKEHRKSQRRLKLISAFLILYFTLALGIIAESIYTKRQCKKAGYTEGSFGYCTITEAGTERTVPLAHARKYPMVKE